MNIYDDVAYNKLKPIRKLPKYIVDYLFTNCPDLWKLLKYKENPLLQSDLTNSQKSEMIAKSSFNNESCNVLFQPYSSDAMKDAVSQVRVFIGDVLPENRTSSLVRIIIQVVVNNKDMIVNTKYSPVDKRDVAIAQTIIEVLNGAKLEVTGNQLFLDKTVDRYSGMTMVRFNNEYSGFEITMDTWV